MKYLRLGMIIFTLCLFDYNRVNSQEHGSKINPDRATKSSKTFNDKQEIQELIRKVLNWSDSKKSINLLPVIIDSKNKTYTGFDLEKLKSNLEKLKETGFFSTDFIENYNQIVLTRN